VREPDGASRRATWIDIGSSFLPGELVAAFLLAQLEASDSIQADRAESWNAYDRALRRYQDRGLRTPTIPSGCGHNAHLYYVILPTPEQRDALIAQCSADGIATPFHYVPLHNSPAGRRFGRVSGDLPITEEVSARLVRLPLYPRMGEAQTKVIERLHVRLEVLLP